METVVNRKGYSYSGHSIRVFGTAEEIERFKAHVAKSEHKWTWKVREFGDQSVLILDPKRLEFISPQEVFRLGWELRGLIDNVLL